MGCCGGRDVFPEKPVRVRVGRRVGGRGIAADNGVSDRKHSDSDRVDVCA